MMQTKEKMNIRTCRSCGDGELFGRFIGSFWYCDNCLVNFAEILKEILDAYRNPDSPCDYFCDGKSELLDDNCNKCTYHNISLILDKIKEI